MPRLAIKLIRDKKLNHRFYELFNKKRKIIQDGPKEYLLCGEHEQQISKYEEYFKESIYLGRHRTKKTHDGKRLLIENLDYKKMKLFFLSLLWRASISSKPEFENVCLGPDEEIIRNMIFSEDPGKSSEFAVAAIVPFINPQHSAGWSTNFLDLKYEGAPTLYGIVIGGFFYLISTAYDTKPDPPDLILNESGRWIMLMRDVSEIGCLWKTIKHQFNN